MLPLLARAALRSTEGLSVGPATILVLGGAATIIGVAATEGPWPAGGHAAVIGQICLALLRCALIVGGRLELRSRAAHEDLSREQGPSPLFYACVGIGSLPLAVLAIDLGTHNIVVLAVCIALSAMVVDRQYIQRSGADQADRSGARPRPGSAGWSATRRTSSWRSMPHGTIDYVSPSVERLLRSPDGPAARHSLTDLAHPDDVAALATLIERATAAPGRRVSGEWRAAAVRRLMAARSKQWRAAAPATSTPPGSCSTPATSRSARRWSRS